VYSADQDPSHEEDKLADKTNLGSYLFLQQNWFVIRRYLFKIGKGS
jgi:hypothetical protein